MTKGQVQSAEHLFHLGRNGFVVWTAEWSGFLAADKGVNERHEENRNNNGAC
jgi:hypothetical protein